MRSHESLTSFRKVAAGSDRKFGLTVGMVLSFIAVWPAIRHHAPLRLWLLTLGAALIIAALARPASLGLLNRLWFRLGLLLASITNPIVMGLMYFAAVVPLGWFLKRRGHDLLRLKSDATAETYWIARERSAPASLTKQF